LRRSARAGLHSPRRSAQPLCPCVSLGSVGRGRNELIPCSSLLDQQSRTSDRKCTTPSRRLSRLGASARESPLPSAGWSMWRVAGPS
jgi:hypothetical protein